MDGKRLFIIISFILVVIKLNHLETVTIWISLSLVKHIAELIGTIGTQTQTPGLHSESELAFKDQLVLIVPDLQVVSEATTLLKQILVVDLDQDGTQLVSLTVVAVVHNFDKGRHLDLVHHLIEVGVCEVANLGVKVCGFVAVSVVEPFHDLFWVEKASLPGIHEVFFVLIRLSFFRRDRALGSWSGNLGASNVFHLFFSVSDLISWSEKRLFVLVIKIHWFGYCLER